MNDSSRESSRSLVPTALVALAFAVPAAMLAVRTTATAGIDDSFITYVFARSFAAGDGLTWPGSNALGTSSPFLAVVLGLLSRVSGADVPLLGNALSWAALALTGVGMFELGRAEGWPRAGLVAGALWLLTAPSHFLLCNEYLPALAAVVGAFAARATGRLALAGVLLTIAAMFRAETGLAAPLLALLEFRRDEIQASLARIAHIATVAMGIAAIWLAVLYSLTDTIVPRTLAAKQAQGESTLGWSQNAMAQATFGAPNRALPLPVRAWWAPLAIVGGATIVYGLRRRRTAAVLVAWGACHVALLIALGLPFYDWYAAPFRFGALVLASFAVEPPWLGASRPRALGFAWITIALVAFGAVAAPLFGQVRWLGQRAEPRRLTYQRIAERVDRYPEGTRIAALEVGYFGWFAQRPIADLLGLVSDRASLAAVRDGRLRENLDHLEADLVAITLGSRKLFASIVGDPKAFTRDFALEHLELDSTPPVAIYRRQSLAPRSAVAIDLLSELPADRAVSVHHLDGVELLAIELAAGERISLSAPPGPRRTLVAQLATSARRSRLTLTIQGDPSRAPREHRRGLKPKRWLESRWTLPPTIYGTTLTFECAPARRRNACVIAQPFLGNPEERPNAQAQGRKRQSRLR